VSHSPFWPSSSSLVESAWPACRAVSLIRCRTTHRRSCPSAQLEASERWVRSIDRIAESVFAARSRYAFRASSTLTSSCGRKLLLAAAHLGSKESTVDPSPLHFDEMTDDSEKWDQATIGDPSCLGVIEAIEISRHRSAQIDEPLEEKFLLVGAASRKPDVVRHGANRTGADALKVLASSDEDREARLRLGGDHGV
jgi:hypothetical protein